MNTKRALLDLGVPELDDRAFSHVGDRKIKLFSGGGGGGGPKYENLEKLYAAQAGLADLQAADARFLQGVSREKAYPALFDFAQESQDYGSLANKEEAAGNVAADIAGATGAAKARASESLASMGVNPNDARFARTFANMDLAGAVESATQQNAARNRIEDLGFARKQDATSMLLGLPAGAASAIQSAGNLYGGASNSAGGIANLQAQQKANSDANNAAIASLATRFMLKDGGEVVSPQRLRAGGMACAMKRYAAGGAVTANPMRPNYSTMPVTAPGAAPAGKTMAQQAADVFTGATVSKGAKGIGSAIESGGNLVGKFAPDAGNAISSFGRGMQLGKNAAPAIEEATALANGTAASSAGAAAADVAAQYGISAGGEQAAMLAAQEIGMGTLATEAAAGTAAAGMGSGAAIGAAVPWVGGALLLGSALGLFKDGGSVHKKRIAAITPGSTQQTGGKVAGPGGPKDDRVPALLSDGEFVLPVGAVKLFGLEKLEEMRQAGLAHEKQIGIEG